jgi:hypothetical protein
MKAISERGVARNGGSMEGLTMITADAMTSDKPIEVRRNPRRRLSLIANGNGVRSLQDSTDGCPVCQADQSGVKRVIEFDILQRLSYNPIIPQNPAPNFRVQQANRDGWWVDCPLARRSLGILWFCATFSDLAGMSLRLAMLPVYERLSFAPV